MDRKIPIHISFYNDRWEKMISDGMHALGWEPVFLHGEVQLSDIQDSELLFGMFPPALLAQCPRLKWLQCSFLAFRVCCLQMHLPPCFGQPWALALWGI